MSAVEFWEWALRLVVAGVLGALVGTEREIRGHAAGIRTQALVAMGSALLTGVGAEAFTGPGADPTRVASQVVTGIGFIGAGVILKHRGTVRGLTTAATLWVSAALGVAVGVGQIVLALLAAGIALAFIYSLRLMKPLMLRNGRRTIHVEYEQGHGTIGPLLRSLQQVDASIDDLDIEDEPDDSGATVRKVTIRMKAKDGRDLTSTLESVARRPEVRQLQIRDN